MKTISKAFLALGLAGALLSACGDSNNRNGDMGNPGGDMEVKPDMPTGDQPDAGACFNNATTHVQLLNACTNADFVDKMPFYPTNTPNGQLPSLP